MSPQYPLHHIHFWMHISQMDFPPPRSSTIRPQVWMWMSCPWIPLFDLFLQHCCEQLVWYIAKLSPAQSNSNFSWLGWDSFNFNFYPPTPTPRESTEISSAQLNPTPTQLVGLIESRISLKPAWAELGTAQSQLVSLSWYNFNQAVKLDR